MSDAPSWLRLYHSILDNQKTASLPPDKFGHWVRILLAASRNSPRGKLPDDKILARYLGESMRINRYRLITLKNYYVSMGLLDKRNEQYWIHNFGSRQWLENSNNSTESTTERCNDKLNGFQVSNDVTGFKRIESPATEQNKRPARSAHPFGMRVSAIYNEYIASWRVLSHNAFAHPASVRQLLLSTSPIAVEQSGNNGKGRGKGRVLLPEGSVPQKRPGFEATWHAWNNSPGLMRHGEPGEADHKAFRLAYDRIGGSKGILTAIQRYSLYMVGSKSGVYRPAFKWTYYEFLTRKQSDLIRRFMADEWEATCLPFDKGKPRQTVAGLLRKAIGQGKG